MGGSPRRLGGSRLLLMALCWATIGASLPTAPTASQLPLHHSLESPTTQKSSHLAGSSRWYSLEAAEAVVGDRPDPARQATQNLAADTGATQNQATQAVAARNVAARNVAARNVAARNSAASLLANMTSLGSVGGQQRGRMLKGSQRRSPAAGAQLTALFIDYLKRFAPAYSNFAVALEKSGFDKVLAQILQGTQVTVMVPLNSALPLSSVKYNSYFRQQLGFHVLYGYWDAKTLSSAGAGTKFPTCANFPRRSDLIAYRLRTSQFELGGRASDKAGSAIFQGNFFSDPQKYMVAHGVSALMTPYRYY